MSEQHLLEPGSLLFPDGSLSEAGYSTKLVKKYSRSDIKANKFRIKEWDYYYIGNDNYGVAFTIADNSYMALAGVSFLDFQNKKEVTKNVMKWFTKGKLNLPASSENGDVFFKNKKCELSFYNNNGKRHLEVLFKNFIAKKNFRCDIYLEETNQDSMVIATPFKKKKHFYYNQKINLLKASGYFKIGDKIYDLNSDSYGVLDWGRGVWTYKNTWYWASLNGISRGKRIGFNLGYGFGDTTNATENMFFYDDKAYKLNDVRFDIPIDKHGKDDYLKPWRFRSNDGAIDLIFQPILNRHASMNVLILKSIQNQVFGRFSGTITINDERIVFTDLLGFAEKVTNHW